MADMDLFLAEVSPFDDPAPAITILNSASSNSETNPFRVRNSSGGSNTPSTPILSAFPVAPTSVPAQPVTSPGPKSKNPFLDLPAVDNSAQLVSLSSGNLTADTPQLFRDEKGCKWGKRP